MAAHTKALSGGGKDKVVRRILASVDDVPEDLSEALETRFCETISSLRIRREIYDNLPDGRRSGATMASAAPVSATSATPAAVATPAFDPFAFSAVAVIARQGEAGLRAELAGVLTVSDLQALATAQHLGVDPALSDIVALRDAIVAGAARRLAERKAAAS
jgi:hypothetical protein